MIGAGIIGMTTAYELVADGHEVTVFERRGSVASEASFANAGVISPGHAVPWAAPGMPKKVLHRLLTRHAPIRVHASSSPGEIAWMWRWWRACNLRTFEANRLRMQRLVHFSRERLHRLTRDLKMDYERSDGCLLLLRTAKEHSAVQPGLAWLAESNTRVEWLDAARCSVVEPGLSDETPLHGGVYLPADEVGNCRQFATLLRGEAQRLGVRFRFHTQVQKIVAGKSPQLLHMYSPPDESTVLMNVAADSTPTDAQDTEPMPMRPVTEDFDQVVVCAALDSAPLLRPHGLKLPMQAVYGYSITAPLRRLDAHGDIGPRSAVTDERYKVTVSRLGARLRVAGGAEIGGLPPRHDPKAIETLYKVLHDWFPGSARLSQAQVWKGARPMLPDGPPVVGRSGIEGVWLNLGHGSNGWAMACGSARLIADGVAGRAPAIDIEGLGVERLLT